MRAVEVTLQRSSSPQLARVPAVGAGGDSAMACRRSAAKPAGHGRGQPNMECGTVRGGRSLGQVSAQIGWQLWWGGLETVVPQAYAGLPDEALSNRSHVGNMDEALAQHGSPPDGKHTMTVERSEVASFPRRIARPQSHVQLSCGRFDSSERAWGY